MSGTPVYFFNNTHPHNCFCCAVLYAAAGKTCPPKTKKWLNVSDDLKYFSNFVIVKQCNGWPSGVKTRVAGIMLLFVSVLQNDYSH